MKVDSNTWQLLQTTHQGRLSDAYKFSHRIPLILFLACITWNVLIPVLYPKRPLGLVHFLFGFLVFPVIMFLSGRCFLAYEKRIQRMLPLVTDRVNASLQMDETTAHLMLRIHDVGDVENRRYQFVRRSAVDPIIMGHDIPYMMGQDIP